jgi:hypothetical protein
MDVLDRRTRRGVVVLRADDLLPAAVIFAAGYRCLSAGAEAVARLVLDEWRPLAPAPSAATRNELASLLGGDPAGAEAVANRLGAGPAAAVAAVAGGRWPRRSLLLVDAGRLIRGVLHPVELARRVAGAPAQRACPLLQALANERTVTGDLDEWLDRLRGIHPHVRL